MSVDSFVTEIVNFVKHNEHWAIPIAFLVAFAESFCFLSILWPGTAILAGITALLAASGADQWIVIPSILAAGFGGTLGYAISYWIGLYFKDSIEIIWPFSSRPELLQHGKNFFSKWGGWGIFVGHFIGPVRAVIPVVAGMFEMKQITFQVANALSAFIWSAGIIGPSFFLVIFRQDIILFIHDSPLIIAFCLAFFAFLNAVALPLLPLLTLILFIILGGTFVFYDGDLTLTLIAGTVGAFLGDCTGYILGKKYNSDLKHIWVRRQNLEDRNKAITYLQKKGALGFIQSKFQPSLRAVVPVAAGLTYVSLIKFSTLSLLSCFLWVVCLLCPILLLKVFFGM